MKMIGFIEQPDIIENILRHLHLWQPRNHDPPASASESFQVAELQYDDSDTQIPPYDDWC
jgi:hypothetical protein